MFCECYRQPLTDAASRGDVLPKELTAHLDACHLCASAFAAERALFAAIDRSLLAVANSEVPASLLASVRTRRSEVVPRKIELKSWIFAATAAAAILLLTAITVVHRQVSTSGHDVPGISGANNAETRPAVEMKSNPVLPQQMPRKRVRPERGTSTGASLLAKDVLVPSDERLALVRLAAQLRAQPGLAKAYAGAASAIQKEDIQIPPIEIDELNLKPIAEGEHE